MKNCVLGPHPGYKLFDSANQIYLETQKELGEQFLCDFYGMPREMTEDCYKGHRMYFQERDPDHFITIDLSYCEETEQPIVSVFNCKDPEIVLDQSNIITYRLPMPSKEKFWRSLVEKATKLAC